MNVFPKGSCFHHHDAGAAPLPVSGGFKWLLSPVTSPPTRFPHFACDRPSNTEFTGEERSQGPVRL